MFLPSIQMSSFSPPSMFMSATSHLQSPLHNIFPDNPASSVGADAGHVTWRSIDFRQAQGLELRLMLCNFAHAGRRCSVPRLHTQNKVPMTDTLFRLVCWCVCVFYPCACIYPFSQSRVWCKCATLLLLQLQVASFILSSCTLVDSFFFCHHAKLIEFNYKMMLHLATTLMFWYNTIVPKCHLWDLWFIPLKLRA